MKKRLKKLYVKKFIENLLPSYFKVKFTKDSYIDFQNGVVSIALESSKFDLEFNDFTEEEFGIRLNYLLMSILHEVGHFYTFDFVNKISKEIVMSDLVDKYNKSEIDLPQFNQEYWRLPLERNATEWGINFYLDNKEFCEDFLRKMQLSIDKN